MNMSSPEPNPTRLDEHGFPMPADDSGRLSRRYPVICPTCLDATGIAHVSLTGKYGLATVFCKRCGNRAFANTRECHDLMRRWQYLLQDEAFRSVLRQQLADVP